PPTLVQKLQFQLVDAERQKDRIKENDPQNLIRQSIDEHKEVTDGEIGQAVREAFANGLLALSEIAFDQKHNRAVVGYGFRCGMLCGHGAILVLEKVGADWKILN